MEYMQVKPITRLIKNRKIRLALIGCGRISSNHLKAFSHHQNEIELIAICDHNTNALKKTNIPSQVQRFEDYRTMLQSLEIDVVVIATPSGLHSEHAILAAQKGCHVICEKPMALTWQDGKRMINACDDAGVHLFIVKQNRMNPTLVALKKAIDEKRFGRIYMVNVNVFWQRDQNYYNSAAWRGTWEFDGGAFMNQASHYVDLLYWLIGSIESVHSFTSTLARNIEVEDTGVANIKWRSGALGSINVTMLTYPQNLEGSITVIGEHGTVKIGGIAVNKIECWDFADKKDSFETVAKLNYDPSTVYGDGHIKYYENVISALRGSKAPATDGREGLKALEALIAIYRSAKTGKRVALPLDD